MKLFTISEIARTLGIPESTAHYYRKRFSEYLPSEGEGRYRRYRSEAIDVFTLIVSLVKEGVSLNEVETALQQQFPIAVEIEQQPTTIQRQQQNNSMLQELMSEAISTAIQQQTQQISKEIELLRREVAVTQAENERLHNRLEEHVEQRTEQLNEVLQLLREQREQQQKQKRRWWQRGE